MIVRAIFWVGLVFLLSPYEPNLGMGHPATGTSQAALSALLSGVSQGAAPQAGCDACSGKPLLDIDSVMARLAAMRGELAAARQARTAHADSTAHT